MVPPTKTAGDDQRAVEADGADCVVEDAVVGPLGEGLFFGFGEAEVDLGAEELVDGHVAVGGEEFLGADEAEGVVEVGGHEVLAAFAAVEGEDGDARALAAGEVGQHAAVLVVGVGDDEHEGGAGAELAQELLECGSAVIEGEGVGEVLRRDALAGEVGGVLLGGELGRRGKGARERGGRARDTVIMDARWRCVLMRGLLSTIAYSMIEGGVGTQEV